MLTLTKVVLTSKVMLTCNVVLTLAKVVLTCNFALTLHGEGSVNMHYINNNSR